ncbi:MAG: VOC family protein [Candidatus Dormibacterales bacterium]
MKMRLVGVYVPDQEKALRFYTQVLGFQKKEDVPVGTDRWLTVVSPEEPDGPELLLSPDGHPAVRPYKDALTADGIPVASFQVDDLDAELRRLRDLGVTIIQEPFETGKVITAVIDDTCGNLIQLAAHIATTDRLPN